MQRKGSIMALSSPPSSSLWAYHTTRWEQLDRPVFKIEVFNALQTRFGPSKYTSLKMQLFKTQPQIENEDITGSRQYDIPAHKNQQA
jgi:hypothetical protein